MSVTDAGTFAARANHRGETRIVAAFTPSCFARHHVPLRNLLDALAAATEPEDHKGWQEPEARWTVASECRRSAYRPRRIRREIKLGQ